MKKTTPEEIRAAVRNAGAREVVVRGWSGSCAVAKVEGGRESPVIFVSGYRSPREVAALLVDILLPGLGE